MRQNKRTSPVSQSIAVSVLLLAALFLLPLAVVAPFRPALFGREEPVDEPEREAPAGAGWGGGPGDGPGDLSGGGGPGGDARLL